MFAALSPSSIPVIRISKACVLVFWLWLIGLSSVHAGTATGISGLYYTGVNDSGGLLNATSQDSHWTVTYAYANGTSGNTSYQGKAYVVSSSQLDGAWAPNTSSAQWIVPPGAALSQSGQGINGGGDYLPGNGTSGNNRGVYVYTLSFYIAGTGSGTVTNQMSISLTLAADDQAKVYVNPTLNTSGSINTSSSTLGGTLTNAWTNTSTLTLQNYGTNANASFVIGKNTLVIEVDNTNSLTGSSSATSLNPSGLMVYQTGSMAVIDGKPVPEVGTWLIALVAVTFFAWQRARRVRAPKPALVTQR